MNRVKSTAEDTDFHETCISPFLARETPICGRRHMANLGTKDRRVPRRLAAARGKRHGPKLPMARIILGSAHPQRR